VAQKFFCDGCDRELVARPIKEVRISIVQSSIEVGPGEVHLCDGCFLHLKREANPKTWVRIVPEAV